MTWMVAVLTWDADKKMNHRGTRSDSLRELLSTQFNVYCPRVREIVARAGRRLWLEDWLLGRYAFVEKLADWRDVFTHRGVAEVLGGREPAVVQDEEIYRFRDLEDADGFVVLPRRSKMRRGDSCRITQGPFADELAIYSGMGRRDRELAFVEILGRKVRVEVAAGTLVPA